MPEVRTDAQASGREADTQMTVTEIKQAQLANAIDPSKPMTKVLQVLTLAAEPSEKQVEMIRPYLLRDFSPDELYIRQMELANDQVDRSFERFDRGYLKRFAETIVGKSVLTGHEYGNAPVGRFFDAAVAKGANGWQWVKPWFYMPKSPGNQLARDNIDSGVWSYVSIGAYATTGCPRISTGMMWTTPTCAVTSRGRNTRGSSAPQRSRRRRAT